MRIRSRKGILLTLVTIVLFVLMLAELITYVVININYSNLSTAASVTLSTGAFTQSLGSGTSSFIHDSLRRALDALIYYEGNATLRRGTFVNNTALELESLMNNGTIYGSSVLKGYMNGYTLSNFTKSLVIQAANQNMGLSITNSSITVYQDSPFTLNVSYTALAVLNSTGGTITYPIRAKGSVSLNGTMDLYSVESGNPQQIKVMNNSLVTVVGNTRAVSGSTSPFMFVYGTLLVEPSGIVCSSIPAQYRNINYILTTSNAADVNQSVCNMGGLVTNVTNSSTPLKPYLVYSNSASIFNYLQNGTKLLLSGGSMALLNISGLKNAYNNNYYYSSLSSPSYLDSAESNLNHDSANGMSSLGYMNRYVTSFPGKYRANITSRLIYKNTTPTTITAWINPTSFTEADGGSNIVAYGGLLALYSNHLRYYTCGIGNGGGGTIIANQWTFVAVTISASPNPTVITYVNGETVSSDKYTGNTASSTGSQYDNFTIGGTGYSGCNVMNFTGSIANVNVYNTTLSAEQINQIYQEGLNGVPISNSKLAGLWPLNGNANDYSGYNNNGTPANILYNNLNNYVGNPLKYGAIYNPYNYMTVAGFSCDNAASCNSSSLSMPSSAYVLPITLKNSQSIAAPAPFQQMVTFNPSAYSAYEASNLGNIRFYQNGTELYSWCESGCDAASSNAIFWVKLPNGMPANSNMTIKMVFGTTNTNYDGVYAGEAPQLSPTYAEYDNGANVFNFYDNFAGTTLNTTKWSNVGSSGTSGSTSGIAVNNGLSLTGGGQGGVSHQTWIRTSLSSGSFNTALVADVYENSPSTATTFRWGFTNSNPTYFGGGPTPLSSFGEQIYDDGNWYTDTDNGSSSTQNEIGSWASLAGTYVFWSIVATSSEVLFYTPNTYSTLGSTGQTITATVPAYSSSIGLSLTNEYTSPIYVKWVRVRAYPPNGVMPSVKFGSIAPYPPSSSQNMLGSINGALLPDAAIFNGASGYIEISNSNSLNLPSSATVSMWIYPYTNTSSYSNIEGKGSGQPFIQFVHSNLVAAGIWGVGQTASIQIPSNAWSFVTATYAPTSNTVTLYLNGSYATSSTFSTGISNNTYPLQLGSTGPTFSNGGYFNGRIADVQLYGTTLSTTQVQELYLNNSVLGGSPISYWPLNGGTGGLMNVTPNFVSGSSGGQLYSGGAVCTNAGVINGACGVNFVTASGSS